MSLSWQEKLELMAFADGELEGEAEARVEALLGASAEARTVVAAIRAAGIDRWLGEAIEQRSETADGIADVVMARLDAGPAARGAGMTDGRGAVGRPVGPWSPRNRVRVVVFGGAALVAAAAAVALVVRGRPDGRSTVVATTAAPAPQATVSAGAPEPEERASAAGGVVVDEIDSPAGQVSIFQIPSLAHAASSVVVWVDDDPGAK
jgi:hypothetical protein